MRSRLQLRHFSVLTATLGALILVACGSDENSPADDDLTGGTAGSGGTTAGEGGSAGSAGSGNAGSGNAGTAGSGGCSDTQSDGENCGACGNSCLGGTCKLGECQPVVMRTSFPSDAHLQVDDGAIFFVNSTNNHIFKGEKKALATDEVLLAQNGTKASFTALNDALYWYDGQGPVTVRSIAKTGGDASEVMKIDAYQPGVVFDPQGIFFTSLYELRTAPLTGGDSTLLKPAPNGKTFNAPATGLGIVAVRMGNTGLDTSSSVTTIPKAGGGLAMLTTLGDSNITLGVGPSHVVIAHVKSKSPVLSLCNEAPSAEVLSVSRSGGKPVSLATDLGHPTPPLVDGQHAFWRDRCDGSLWHAFVDGEQPAQKLYAGESGSQGAELVMDATSLFFDHKGTLLRLAKPKSTAEEGESAGGSGGSGGGSICAHNACSSGSKLEKDCSPCVSAVCALDPFCCSKSWDSNCLTLASSVSTCACTPSGEGGSGGASGSAGTSGSAGSSGGSTCSHNVCDAGTALSPACSTCAAEVCADAPECCTDEWDDWCVWYAEYTDSCECTIGAPSCDHSACVLGDPLLASCSTCAALVCEEDESCCNNKWDPFCVAAALTFPECGCSSGAGGSGGTGGSGGSGGSSGSAGSAGSSGSAGPGGSSGSAGSAGSSGSAGSGGSAGSEGCAHSACEIGAPLFGICNACNVSICEHDPYCCQVAWDASCVKLAMASASCDCSANGAGGESGTGGAGSEAGSADE